MTGRAWSGQEVRDLRRTVSRKLKKASVKSGAADKSILNKKKRNRAGRGSTVKSKWTKQSVGAIIKERHKAGLGLSRQDMLVGGLGSTYGAAQRRLWDSWYAALIESGLSHEEIIEKGGARISEKQKQLMDMKDAHGQTASSQVGKRRPGRDRKKASGRSVVRMTGYAVITVLVFFISLTFITNTIVAVAAAAGISLILAFIFLVDLSRLLERLGIGPDLLFKTLDRLRTRRQELLTGMEQGDQPEGSVPEIKTVSRKTIKRKLGEMESVNPLKFKDVEQYRLALDKQIGSELSETLEIRQRRAALVKKATDAADKKESIGRVRAAIDGITDKK